jgi:uncharacterized protein (TIGR02145 family)
MKSKHFFLLILMIAILTLMNCKKNEGSLSIVKTYFPKYIASSSATIGCIVESDGGSGIAACGVYMSISQNPEISGTKAQMGNDTGLFLGRVIGLMPNKQYYVKAYANNTKGEALGEEINFTTPSTITDYDNNVYETVKIGSQLWMAKNLRTTHYLNGDLLETTNPATLDISSQNSPKYQWSNGGTDDNNQVYGKLYTWYAIMDSRKICPIGWHVPSDSEWTTMETTLGGYSSGGSKLKESGNSHWISPYNTDATDESCFSGLPGGYRDMNGSFFLIQNEAYIWSSTESETAKSWARTLNGGTPAISRLGVLKSRGLSVRCIKDN